MKNIVILVIGLSAACSKSETPPKPNLAVSTPETQKPEPIAPAANAQAIQKPEQPPPPRPGSAPVGTDKELRPLSTYLVGAVVATVVSLTQNRDEGVTRKVIKKLDEKATKAYLATIDLSQKGNGGLVRCMSDTEVELRDSSGKLLGTIGFCGSSARFDAPDGAFDGINASKP